MGKKEKQLAQKPKVEVPAATIEAIEATPVPEVVVETAPKVSEELVFSLTGLPKPSLANAVMVDGNIAFYVGSVEVLKFCPNGKAYVRGELMERNQALYEQVKLFFKEMNRP